MQYKITIPKPCHEGWDNMAPNNAGRFCNSCAKTVIDFTLMTDEEVQHFFVDHQQQAVCGHFKRDQVHRIVIDLPDYIFSAAMPAWMRFLVACLLIFGLSIFPFETTIAGKLPSEISFYQGEPMLKKQDTIPFIKKTLRPDKAVETNFYYDGFVVNIPEKISRKNKPKPDSIKSCAPNDSLKNDSLKTSFIKDPKLPRQKKRSGQKEPESFELISPALLPGKEKSNTESMD